MLVLDLKHGAGGECKACQRINQIKRGENPYFVAELETGYVVLGDFQFFRGYTVFICRHHKAELHELPEDFRLQFLKEMSQVAESVFKAFEPERLNYELLGNTSPHLYWHIFPRYAKDPKPQAPVWCIDKAVCCSDDARPSKKELNQLKRDLLSQLERRAKIIEKAKDIPLPDIFNL
ncbi:HIT family protein [Candidatus Parcubacteria bacterium]|nr:MAG: HIT family protein [Candidatus Parcubacteria bacterium]